MFNRMVYVLSNTGTSLMPTERYGSVRRMMPVQVTSKLLPLKVELVSMLFVLAVMVVGLVYGFSTGK